MANILTATQPHVYWQRPSMPMPESVVQRNFGAGGAFGSSTSNSSNSMSSYLRFSISLRSLAKYWRSSNRPTVLQLTSFGDVSSSVLRCSAIALGRRFSLWSTVAPCVCCCCCLCPFSTASMLAGSASAPPPEVVKLKVTVLVTEDALCGAVSGGDCCSRPSPVADTCDADLRTADGGLTVPLPFMLAICRMVAANARSTFLLRHTLGGRSMEVVLAAGITNGPGMGGGCGMLVPLLEWWTKLISVTGVVWLLIVMPASGSYFSMHFDSMMRGLLRVVRVAWLSSLLTMSLTVSSGSSTVTSAVQREFSSRMWRPRMRPFGRSRSGGVLPVPASSSRLLQLFDLTSLNLTPATNG
uniref:Uncharacterized protein n=1 Tax=Anopheles atroparvus TaxID=41427 RepID=A0A182J840_ANOAO